VLVGFLAALVIGFLSGLLSFKVKTRWCPACGRSTTDLQAEIAAGAGHG
jgi:NADH pyrophosphatase NudC (nudix superfamily)